jgi:hypothetical protein
VRSTTITESQIPETLARCRLREIAEGQVLQLAGLSFAVVGRRQQQRLIHLDLEAEDGAPATLIGVPGARFRLHEQATTRPP